MSFGVALSALLVNEVHASNGECIPIETLFAQPVYEVNVNSTNIGGYNTTGAVDVWSGNPLRAGSLDGDIIGRSTGKCTLLPGEQMWMCSGIFKISINNTITTMGLSPNNVERGSLAVTGGTGCYQNANGTIFITSQGETSESFLLEYQASDADETCSVQDLVGEGLSEANVGGTTIGDYETVGSKDLWAGNVLTNSSGARIGLSYGDCTLLPGVAAFMCIGEWALDSGDIVTYAGYSPNSMNPGHIAVTGGTGCYAGANGTLLLKAANEQYSSYDWNYQPKPEAETCSSLVDTLGGHLIYESTSGSIVIGDYDTPGSMDIWFNSSIYTGSHDGALLEGMYSLGECTLLTNVTEFMCALQFVLNATDGSSIVATGFSPNSFEDGTLAISGTGCFTGIKGELTITAQSIEEDYDYFSYEVKSTNEKAVASGVDAGKETDSSMGEEAGSNTVDEISSETVDESTEVESEKEGECIPIETLFSQPAYEVNVNATTIGGSNVTGAVYIWSENPLRTGSVDGAAIGKSTGKCTLLPGEQMWMCSGIFKISNQDTITTMGLSPNNQEKGSLAVTGGTGCYQNANGTIFITSQGEPSESFLLEYQASNADEPCSVQDLVGEGLSEANAGGTTIGDYETVGSKDLWAGNVLTNSSGARIGLSYGDCTLLPGVAAFMCIGEWALDSGDIVTYAGYSPNSMNPGHIAVTGGTGCYAGANGTLLLKAANEQFSSYDWNYQPKPEAETCSSLVDTLGGHLIYESTSGSIVIGDYDTPGSMDIWFNSSMYTGSHDGALLEGMYSLGECTLLTNVTEFMCTEQFVLNATDGSSIVAIGFSPNSFKDGTLAISGTGCFTGIKGGLAITAQSIEEDYDYFSYEVKSTNEADGPSSDSGVETETETGTGDFGTEETDSVVDAGTGSDAEESSGDDLADNSSCVLHLNVWFSAIGMAAAIPIL